MKKTSLLPLIVFCIFFLAYTIHFVLVVNNEMGRLENNSFIKSAQRMMDDKAPSAVKKPAPVVQRKTPPPVREKKVEVVEVKEVPTEEDKKLPPPQEKLVRYVNYTWLNVREQPTLASSVIEKLTRNDEVEVIELTTASWAKIVTPQKTEGYVARRYLSSRPVQEEKVASIVPEKTEAPPNEETVTNIPDLYTVPIISYHHITDTVGVYARNLTLPEKNFIAQLDWLIANDFETLDFRDLKAISEGKKKMTTKQVILTFDDGYDDAYTAAMHLNGKGLKGVFYIITENVGEDGYLDWRQIKKMNDWGMEIGSHGVTSANLAFTSDVFIQKELEDSKKKIEEEIGADVVSFSYPAGGYTNEVMADAKEAGYSFARSIRSGSQYLKNEFYQLPTLRVFPPAGARQFSAWLGGR